MFLIFNNLKNPHFLQLTMTNKELIEELSIAFTKEQERLGFISSFEIVDKYFGITDMVLSDAYVSAKFIRSVNRRILDAYNGWVQFCHAHIMPQPGNMLQMEESKCLNEEDRKVMTGILNRVMELSSRNALIGITEKIDEEGKFIDDAVSLWETDIKLKLEVIFKKINTHWKNQKVDSKDDSQEVPKSYNGVV